MTNALDNRLYLKQQIYSFKMMESKSIAEQQGDINKILDELENTEVKLDDEDDFFPLDSQPKFFELFKGDNILYDKDQTISLDEV